MKKLLTILFLIIAITSKSQVSVTAGGGIAPTGSYAGYYGTYLQGATKVVYDTIARNAIPSYYRDTLTFMVYTKVDSSYWILNGGISNSNFKKVSQFNSALASGNTFSNGVIQDIPFYSGVNSLSYTANLSIDTLSGTTYYYIGKTTKNNYIPLSTDPSNPSVGISVYSKTNNGFTEPYYIDSLGNSSRLSTVGGSSKNTGTGISPLTPVCLDSTSSIAKAKGSNPRYPPFAISLDSIPNNGYGRIVYNGGIVTGLNLSIYNAGQNVYLGDNGGISPNPSTLYPAIKLGVVTSNTLGSMLVAIGNVPKDSLNTQTYVPYTGAVSSVNLGTNNLTANNLTTTSATSSLLKTNSSGTLVAATAGTDYQAPISAGTDITIASNVVSADTTTGPTKLATQGYVTRNSGSGGLTGNGTVSSAVVPLTVWSVTNSKVSTTGTRSTYDTTSGVTVHNATVTASGALAIGGKVTDTLNAAANGDTLIGIDIKPTVNLNAKTGVSMMPVRISSIYNTGSIYNSLLGLKTLSTTGYGNIQLQNTGRINYINGIGGTAETFLSVANKYYLQYNNSIAGGIAETLDSNGNFNFYQSQTNIGGSPINVNMLSSGYDPIQISSTSNNTYGTIASTNSSGGKAAFGMCGSSTSLFANCGINGTVTGNDFVLYTNNTERARFKSAGNFLINTTSDDGSNKLQVNGSISLKTAGNKINIATGTNASIGTATLSSGTVTVSTTAVTSSSKIFVTHAGSSISNAGTLYIGTISANTSFIINSTNSSDNDTINWFIIN